jgi:hypothetical protein
MKTQRQIVRTSMDQQLGKAHPLSLLDRLGATVEFSPWYTTQGALQSPWSRPIIPIDMISVLLNHAKGAQPFPIRGPSVAVFADQEIRLNQGPLFVGDSYEVEREVVAVSGSRRTENMWVCTRVYARGADALLATMLVNFEIIDASHLHYERQRRL